MRGIRTILAVDAKYGDVLFKLGIHYDTYLSLKAYLYIFFDWYRLLFIWQFLKGEDNEYNNGKHSSINDIMFLKRLDCQTIINQDLIKASIPNTTTFKWNTCVSLFQLTKLKSYQWWNFKCVVSIVDKLHIFTLADYFWTP